MKGIVGLSAQVNCIVVAAVAGKVPTWLPVPAGPLKNLMQFADAAAQAQLAVYKQLPPEVPARTTLVKPLKLTAASATGSTGQTQSKNRLNQLLVRVKLSQSIL